MNFSKPLLLILFLPFVLASCVTKKKFAELQGQLDKATAELHSCNEQRDLCRSDLKVCQTSLQGKQDQMNLLSDQLNDCKATRDKQLTQVGDLTVLSNKANENINQTLAQLEGKDKYIQMLLAAKNKADSINLALSINLKGVLKE